MSEQTRILIIDDESAMRDLLRLNLKSGFNLAEADSGQKGLELAANFHPHLIILDLGLPDINGFDVLKELRKWTTIPVIILTVSDDEKTKVTLLDSGADDFLTKPFSVPELLARIRVGLRNHNLIEATPVFTSGDLKIDLNHREISVSGKIVKLTHTEFELLRLLVRDHGKVVSQNHLLKQIWGAASDDQSHYLRIYINQLRKKIETHPSEPKHMLTEPGVGYRLV